MRFQVVAASFLRGFSPLSSLAWVEGEGAIDNIRQRTAREIVVPVEHPLNRLPARLSPLSRRTTEQTVRRPLPMEEAAVLFDPRFDHHQFGSQYDGITPVNPYISI
jgi:hypothetical protein